ncbi:MAG: hypothetical protein WBF08_00365 [Candidatus Bathyarchaeia archaeon]
MKRIVTASELFKEDEYEIIFLPESLCDEIDEAIEQTNIHHNRDDFVSSAVEKFISDVSEEKVRNPRIK